MIDAGSLEYAHARLCARFGDRPDELVWRRIETIREFDAHARGRAGVAARRLDREDRAGRERCTRSELAMRAHWRERVAEIAAWMPAAWRAAIEWCALLVDLPVLQHLARGGAAPRWLARRSAACGIGRRSRAPRAGSARRCSRAAGVDPDRIAAIWRAEWDRRLPDRRRTHGRCCARPSRLLAEHRDGVPRSAGSRRLGAAARAARPSVAALPPRDARSGRGVHLPRALRAGLRAPARRDPAPRRISAAAARRMIRPQPARWFELLVARDDATLALEALARTGAVELEARPTAVLPAGARRHPSAAASSSRSCRCATTPTGRPIAARPSAFPEPPATTLERCLARIRAWAADAEPVIQQLQRGEAERAELAALAPRARRDGRVERRLRADGRCRSAGARRGCSCFRPTPSPRSRRAC